MGDPNKHNHDYDPAGVPNNYPFAVGDRFYAQDIFRDFDFLQHQFGISITDFISAIPVLVSGGICSQGSGDSLNITKAFGYLNFDINVPLSYASIPPTIQTVQRVTRVGMPAQTNFAIPSAVLDNSTTNYVKLKYKETDGATRNRAKKAGSYVYEKITSFDLVVDAVAPTTEILLATFVGPIGGPYVFVQSNLFSGINFGASLISDDAAHQARRMSMQ